VVGRSFGSILKNQQLRAREAQRRTQHLVLWPSKPRPFSLSRLIISIMYFRPQTSHKIAGLPRSDRSKNQSRAPLLSDLGRRPSRPDLMRWRTAGDGNTIRAYLEREGNSIGPQVIQTSSREVAQGKGAAGNCRRASALVGCGPPRSETFNVEKIDPRVRGGR